MAPHAVSAQEPHAAVLRSGAVRTLGRSWGDRGRLAGPSSGRQVIKECSGRVNKQPVTSGGHRFSCQWPERSESRLLTPTWPSLTWEPFTRTQEQVLGTVLSAKPAWGCGQGMMVASDVVPGPTPNPRASVTLGRRVTAVCAVVARRCPPGLGAAPLHRLSSPCSAAPAPPRLARGPGPGREGRTSRRLCLLPPPPGPDACRSPEPSSCPGPMVPALCEHVRPASVRGGVGRGRASRRICSARTAGGGVGHVATAPLLGERDGHRGRSQRPSHRTLGVGGCLP